MTAQYQPQPASALLSLPFEIREKIWKFTFFDRHIIPSSYGQLKRDDCMACIHIANENADLPTWQQVFRSLRTCKQIFNEARDILMESFTLHLGTPLGHPMRAFTPLLANMNAHIRRLEWRIHVLEENRMDWLASISIIGTQFPNLEKLVVHGHLHAPEYWDYKLLDAFYIALPMARLKNQRMPRLQLDFKLAYVTPIKYGYTALAHITAEDARKQHEEMIKDLIEDPVFVTAALAQDLDVNQATAEMIRRAWDCGLL